MENPDKTDLEFTNDSMESVLKSVPFGGHAILAICVIFLLIALIWSNLATLNEETRAMGRVVPSSSMQVIQSLDGGIVEKILIHEGDAVEKGQVLMEIDDTDAASAVNQAKVKMDSLKAKIARLMAESQGKPLVFPEELTKSAPQLVQSEIDLYTSRQKEQQAQVSVLTASRNSKQQQLIEAEGQLEQLKSNYNIAVKELDINKPLLAQGVISEVDLLKLQKALNDAKDALSQTQLSIPRLQSDIDGANKQIQESDVKFRTQSWSDLNQAISELKQLGENINALEQKLHNTQMRSPVKGTVNAIHIHTVGGVIKPGDDLIDIVPLEDNLLISADVKPADVANLRPGLPVMVKITAYDFSIYGGLKGTLETISADTIKGPKDENFYEIKVKTDKSYLEHNGNQLPIKPGMAAEVDIVTGHKTVMQYLLKPIIKARREALTEK